MHGFGNFDLGRLLIALDFLVFALDFRVNTRTLERF